MRQTRTDYRFAKKLGVSRTLFLGLTDSTIRRERIRLEILSQGLADEICGKGETWREVFERVYGHDLITGESLE